MRWHLIGIDFHRRWRSGETHCDCMNGDNRIVHHGWYSLEWARGPHLEWFRAVRAYCKSHNLQAPAGKGER